ncbi:MAG TPA: BMP family ABC transporter substrate-binding protein [Chloroflexota bacterium]|nr:BMP family ABC transporter substrate-binding protein [Chloroflexota bacterium]
MRRSRRPHAGLVVALVVVMVLAACRGEEEAGGSGGGPAPTPVVVRNATPLALGGTPNAAALAATAQAQAAGAAGVKPPATPAGAPASGGTPVPSGQGQPAAAQPPAVTKPGTQQQQPLRLGIVQPAWETLHLKEQELGGQVRTVTTADMDDYQRNIDQLIRSGSNVIITVGVDLTQVTQDAAEKNPNVKFLGIDQYQDRVLPNLVGLVYDDDKAGFVAGALAGLMTKSNTVGAVVGPGWMPTMVNLGEGFAAGAEYVNPNVEVLLEYHPGELPEGLNDTTWGRDTALQMVADGADVMFGAGGKTGQAALEAAKSKNVLVIGSEIDQYDADPQLRPVLLTSVVKVLTTQSVQQLIKGLTEGTVKGGNVFGDIQTAPMRENDAKVPKTVKDRLATIQNGLKSGSVKTGVQTR